MYWGDKPFYAYSHYLKEVFGSKVYKLSLDAGFTCPNRDGTLDSTGCIFCSEGGSGDFAASKHLSITDQIEAAKLKLQNKKTGHHYIAYFQAFTNTYAPIEYLKKVYYEALQHPDIIGLSIATRPDCLSQDILDLLVELNAVKKVWIELGLQSIHDNTAAFIRRGYSLACFDESVKMLASVHIDVVVHLILGLPFETREQMLASIDYINNLPISGVKLHLLHILKGTDLGDWYEKNTYETLTLDEYADLVVDCIEKLSPSVVIHRITGDGPKQLLLAPIWSGHKKRVLNTIIKRFKERHTYQGKYF